MPVPKIGTMARGGRAAGPGGCEVDSLLPLALSRPREALARARAVLAGQPGPYEASVAHQAAGIVLREFGDVGAAIGEVRKALNRARQARSAEREADVLATLGVALSYAGRTADGLAAFDRALRRCDGAQAGRVRLRRGIVLWTLGRYAEALDDVRQAQAALRHSGDSLWNARALHNRALLHLAAGSVRRADADFAASGRAFEDAGQDLEASYAVLNRAAVAFFAGDLPAALSLLDETTRRVRPLGVPVTAVSIDRCAVLLAAGLADEALTQAATAVAEIERIRGRSTKKAELLLMAAGCALAAGQPETALDWANSARRLSRSQGSAWWEARAAGTLAQAKHAAGMVSARLLREAEQAAAKLEAVGSGDAARAPPCDGGR